MNRYKRESESVYFICCYSITNTVISLVAYKLH